MSDSYTPSPYPQGPLSAFGNARAFLASQLQKSSQARFDNSLELSSPDVRPPHATDAQTNIPVHGTRNERNKSSVEGMVKNSQTELSGNDRLEASTLEHEEPVHSR